MSLTIDLDDGRPQILIRLEADGVQVEFATAAQSILLELAPTLFIPQPEDNTNFALIYALAKGF